MFDIIHKLPHGNSWWSYPSDIITQSTTYNIKSPPKFKQKFSIDKDKSITPITPIPIIKRKNKINLFDIFINDIDDLFHLYTDNMKRDAKIILIQELKLFINEASFQKLFIGPKLRILMSWLNGNHIEQNNIPIVIQFINWFSSKQLINENSYDIKYIDKNNELYLVEK